MSQQNLTRAPCPGSRPCQILSTNDVSLAVFDFSTSIENGASPLWRAPSSTRTSIKLNKKALYTPISRNFLACRISFWGEPRNTIGRSVLPLGSYFSDIQKAIAALSVLHNASITSKEANLKCRSAIRPMHDVLLPWANADSTYCTVWIIKPTSERHLLRNSSITNTPFFLYTVTSVNPGRLAQALSQPINRNSASTDLCPLCTKGKSLFFQPVTSSLFICP